MYLLILDFACCLRPDRSLFTVPLDTWSICAISLTISFATQFLDFLCAIQFCLFLLPCHSYCVQLASSNAQYHRACFIMVFNFHACMCVEVSFMLSYETLLIGSNTSNISTIIGKYWCESNIIITDKLIYLGICINEYTNERGMRISIS
jgi:hypothetical protein